MTPPVEPADILVLPSTLPRIQLRERQCYLDFLDQLPVRRLRRISQLGLASCVLPNRGYSRLAHLNQSFDILWSLLYDQVSLPQPERRHVMVAAILQETGHAPFSNSLNAIFPPLVELPSRLPPDLSRAVAIARYLQENTDIFDRWALDVQSIEMLIQGETPWRRFGFIGKLLNSVLDVDRFAYLGADTRVLGLPSDVDVCFEKALRWPDDASAPVVESYRASAVTDTLVVRWHLYEQLYFHPLKLACEYFVTRFLLAYWGECKQMPGSGKHQNTPETVSDFLWWDDERLRALMESPLEPQVFAEAAGLQRVLRSSTISVAEVHVPDTVAEVHVPNMMGEDHHAREERLLKCRAPLLEIPGVWIIDRKDLPSFRIHEPDSILARDRTGYVSLERLDSRLLDPRMTGSITRRAIIMYEDSAYGPVQDVLKSCDLVLGGQVYRPDPIYSRAL